MTGEMLIFSPGKEIFKEGDPSGSIYFVKEGSVKIYRERDGVEVDLGEVLTGGVLGTLTLFSRDPRTASARASSQTTLQHFPTDTLLSALKDVPVWIHAILKDSLARLKQTNEKLIDAKINEKKIQQRVGSPIGHLGQISALLHGFAKMGCVDFEGQNVLPAEGFAARAEAILNMRADYIEVLFEHMGKSGLFKREKAGKYGVCLMHPNLAILEEFCVFCRQTEKNGMATFVSPKLHPWMSALVRIKKKSPEGEAWTRTHLCAAITKDVGRPAPESALDELMRAGVIKLVKAGSDIYEFGGPALQKRIIFESTCRNTKDLELPAVFL